MLKNAKKMKNMDLVDDHDLRIWNVHILYVVIKTVLAEIDNESNRKILYSFCFIYLIIFTFPYIKSSWMKRLIYLTDDYLKRDYEYVTDFIK